MLTLNFASFPTLTTERLVLRQLNQADAPALFTMRANPQVMQFIPRPLATSVADAAAHIDRINDAIAQNQGLNWGITRRENAAEVIGTIGYVRFKPEHYRAEAGYLLHPACQGQGLMHEALAAVLAHGFRVLGLHSVEAIIAPENVASARVLVGHGFVQEAFFKESEFYDGKFLDSVHYSLLAPAG